MDRLTDEVIFSALVAPKSLSMKSKAAPCRTKKNWLQTDGWTDQRTDPLIELLPCNLKAGYTRIDGRTVLWTYSLLPSTAVSIPFRRSSVANLLTALFLTGLYLFDGVLSEDVLFGDIVSDGVGLDGVVLPILLVPLLLMFWLCLCLLLLLLARLFMALF